jgi:ribosome assembly protein SQT1
MDSDDKGDENMQIEIEIQNDSIVQLRRAQGQHPVFCIAQHPVHQDIIATGGGDDVGYIIDVPTVAAPPQPSPDGAQVEREVLNSILYARRPQGPNQQHSFLPSQKPVRRHEI